ncbi:hypothetical protein [Serratia sp. M24T3]|uniref:hypothetical protein n=1 Tax=Serratia sp. M24T3 TaxID=932213 RepID=UPI0012F52456|nr:hypothetical protein [Serratia sp. M24T3]
MKTNAGDINIVNLLCGKFPFSGISQYTPPLGKTQFVYIGIHPVGKKPIYPTTHQH